MSKNRLLLMLLILLMNFCLIGCSDGVQISIIPHTVKFETNGGSYVEEMYVSKINEAPSTYKENYLFDGWFLDNHFQNLVIFPYKLDEDATLYAKWVKKADVIKCESGNIKFMDFDLSSSLNYHITPNSFDYDRLEELGYSRMKIVIRYDVYYEKDYNIPFDIGYAGSPKYEVYIVNSSLEGFKNEDLPTSKSSETKTHSYSISFEDLKNMRYTLTFSTNNIQNIVYFDNISISYECV